MFSSVLERLRGYLDLIVEEITTKLVDEIPAFSNMPENFRSTLSDAVIADCELLFDQFNRGEINIGAFDWGDLRGFEFGDILRSFQLGSEIAWKWIKRAMKEAGFSPEKSVQVGEFLWEFYFQSANSVAQGYMKQRERLTKDFNQLLNRIRGIQDREELLNNITEGACNKLGYRRAVFFLFEHDLLTPFSAYDRLDPSWGEWILSSKKRYPLSPLADSPEARAFYEPAIKVSRAEAGRMIAFIRPQVGAYYALIPVNPTGSPKGLLYLEADSSGMIIGERDLELLSSYADTVGMALETTRLYREVLAKRKAMDHLMSRVNTAHEEERARIARELHDSVAQMLLKIIYSAGFAQDFLKEDPGLAVDEIEEVQQRAKECLSELRAIMANLRPTSLDILGLRETISRYAEQFEEEYGILTEVDLCGLESIPPSVELTVFRILQEELTNVRKHSNAGSVRIKSETSEGDLVLTVEDDGVGFDPEMVEVEQESGKHLGLMAMRERAELLGGDLNIDSVPGMGTRISVRLPIVYEGERKW
ncbi:MAG: GAF domain-containing sensor histidine kinase [Actinomycetota bacterium]|nr:GAF domain-containing sensor histidine kinase [Actinomycetota bacterium]